MELCEKSGKFARFGLERNWPMGPSERRLPTGSSTQMAPSANWAVGTNAQFALVGSHEKLGF